jgi:rhomboid protease GluP
MIDPFNAQTTNVNRMKVILRSPGRTLVVINLAIFALMVLSGVSVSAPTSGQLLDWGANFAPLTNCVQPWRLFTSLFVHIGLMHLAFNMWVLWSYAPITEALFGRAGFVILYFSAGLVASATSAFWHPETISAGASGAIFGMVGAMIAALGLSTRRDSPAGPLVAFVVFNVIFGITVPAIDNAAHLGGLGGGWLCGKLLGPPLRAYGGRKLVRYLLPPIFVAVLVVALGSFMDEQRCVDGKLHLAMNKVQKGSEAEALFAVRELSAQYPQNAMVRQQLGRLLAMSGDCEQGLLELEVALALDPTAKDVHGLMAYCYASLGRFDEAISMLKEAMERAPGDEWLKKLLDEVVLLRDAER